MDSEREKLSPAPPPSDLCTSKDQEVRKTIEAMEERYGLSNEHLDLQMRMDAIHEKRAQKRAEELKRRNHPTHMNDIQNEGNDAMEEFSRLVEKEKERIQQVANKENERIMQERRTNGTLAICPLCLEEISPIRTIDNYDGKVNVMMCCGVIHCNDCAKKSMDFMLGKSGNDATSNAKCYNCREPIRSAKYWAKDIKPDDKRHWLLNGLAGSYESGTDGLKKNTNKALILYQRSAELGNRRSQDMMAQFHFYGLSVPKCLQKARYYAEKAANQGEVTSQYILAEMIKASPDNTNTSEEEVFRLYTLAAFQGSMKGRFALGMHYLYMYDLMTRGNEDWRRNLLLNIYWFGKTAEVESKSPEGCKSLPLMALQLDEAMKVWHPGCHSDPLPGYSHIPFITWALNEGGEKADRMMTRPFDYVWKRECASCGSLDKEQLKACARCKAFHYCSKKCQVEHWKAGHKVDCKGHWIEKYFPAIRRPKAREAAGNYV
jgi:hypothetical protein